MKSREDPYIIKFENGKISVVFFERGNPIPHTKFKGRIDSQETIETLKDLREKVGDKKAKKFIDSFLEIGDDYKKRIKKDFGN